MIKSVYKSHAQHYIDFPFMVIVRRNGRSEISSLDEFSTLHESVFFIQSVISDSSVDTVELTFRNYSL